MEHTIDPPTESVEDQLAFVSAKRLKDTSRKVYEGKQIQFLTWVCQNHTSCMSSSFLEVVQDTKAPNRDHVKKFVQQPFSIGAPMDFSAVFEKHLPELLLSP